MSGVGDALRLVQQGAEPIPGIATSLPTNGRSRMKMSLNMTCGLAHRASALPLRLLLVLAVVLLTGCGDGEEDTDTQRGSTLPVDCRTAPSDCA